MDPRLDALHASSDHLRDLVAPLTDADLERPSYASDWTIAQVLSHLGSAAVLMGLRLEHGLRGEALPEEASPEVWDEWNTKAPRAQANDSLEADRALLVRFDALEPEQRVLPFSMGPLELVLADLIGLRLNEHVMHTWDIEVAGDPSATLPGFATPLVVDQLDLIGRFTAKPTGSDRTIAVRTTDPERTFAIVLVTDAATFTTGVDAASVDLTLPAEAFCRLVYGRLDPHHTPAIGGDPAALAELRQVFPGP